MYLPLWLPSGTTFRTIGYGLSRVGNRAFANYVDANLYLTHINNKEDPIPILPGRSLGFVHPSGEVHIQDSGEWAACPGKFFLPLMLDSLTTRRTGQDNPSTECIVGDVPTILDGNLADNNGPYNGITTGC